MSDETIAVCIVTHDSADDLRGCLEAVAAQKHRPLELVVVDCASRDASAEIARQVELGGIPGTVFELGENRGFSGGMNAAFALTRAPYLLTLNADARPRPDYAGRLLASLRAVPFRAAAATGRLVRPAVGGERRIDACGMYLERTWRHLDRGSGELDRGQLHRPERVFGATGAASLFSREALDDVAVAGEIFDSAFHSFREDAELAFRLQERGWEVLYEPRAVAEHRRRVLPSRRRRLPPEINYHSLKNRYLLRAYHQTPANFLRTLLPATLRDLAALAYVLAAERTSLAAYRWLWRHRRDIRQRRRLLQGRCTAPPEAVERWFHHRGLPVE